MTDHNLKPDSEDGSVEQQWISILRERGLSRSRARNIVTGFEAHPRLRRRDVPPEEAESVLQQAITSHPFEEYEPITDPESVRGALVEALQEGIAGETRGPLPSDRESATVTGPAGGMTVDQSAFDSMSPSEPTPAFMYESGGATADDIQELQSTLEDIVTESGLQLGDIAAFTKQCRDEGYDEIIHALVDSGVRLNALEVALHRLENQSGSA